MSAVAEIPSWSNAFAAAPVPLVASTIDEDILAIAGLTFSAPAPVLSNARCNTKSSPAATPVCAERSASCPPKSSAFPKLAATACTPAIAVLNTAMPAANATPATPLAFASSPKLRPPLSLPFLTLSPISLPSLPSLSTCGDAPAAAPPMLCNCCETLSAFAKSRIADVS